MKNKSTKIALTLSLVLAYLGIGISLYKLHSCRAPQSTTAPQSLIINPDNVSVYSEINEDNLIKFLNLSKIPREHVRGLEFVISKEKLPSRLGELQEGLSYCPRRKQIVLYGDIIDEKIIHVLGHHVFTKLLTVEQRKDFEKSLTKYLEAARVNKANSTRLNISSFTKNYSKYDAADFTLAAQSEYGPLSNEEKFAILYESYFRPDVLMIGKGTKFEKTSLEGTEEFRSEFITFMNGTKEAKIEKGDVKLAK